ncbi:MAG: sensor domain-containing diguanylate cyclase [Rhodoferax sp.]
MNTPHPVLSWCKRAALACALALMGAAGLAATSPPPDPQLLRTEAATVHWSAGISAVQEVGPSAGVDAIASGARGLLRSYTADTVFALGADRTLWLHLRIQRQKESPRDWWLDVPMPFLDSITLYQADGSGGWIAQHAGDTLPLAQWTLPSRYPEFHLRLDGTQPTSLWLRVRNYRDAALPLRLSSDAAHHQQALLEMALGGAVLGTLLMLVGWSVLRLLETRESQQGWYVVYTLLMLLVCAQALGLANLWLWPHAPGWANYASTVLPLLGVGASTLFLRHVAALHARRPLWDQCLLWFACLSLPLAMLEWLLHRAAAAQLHGLYFALGPALGIATALRLWRDGIPTGTMLLWAYAPQAVAILYLAGIMLQIYPPQWQASYVMVLGVALSVALLLHALAWRSRTRLELNGRARASDTQDALTGLLVRAKLESHMRDTIRRAENDRHSAAIVLVEVSNFGLLRQAYGLEVAEQCLLRAVVKLHRVLRDVDPAGRVGEARFALVLEGVSSREALTERMVGLIASGLIPLAGLQPEVTLHFHMAAVLLDEIRPNPDTVLDELGDILGGIAPRTRRPIRFMEPATTLPSPLKRDSGFGQDSSGSFTHLADKARQWGHQQAALHAMPAPPLSSAPSGAGEASSTPPPPASTPAAIAPSDYQPTQPGA